MGSIDPLGMEETTRTKSSVLENITRGYRRNLAVAGRCNRARVHKMFDAEFGSLAPSPDLPPTSCQTSKDLSAIMGRALSISAIMNEADDLAESAASPRKRSLSPQRTRPRI